MREPVRTPPVATGTGSCGSGQHRRVLTRISGSSIGVHLLDQPQLYTPPNRQPRDRGQDRTASALIAMDAPDEQDLACRAVGTEHPRNVKDV